MYLKVQFCTGLKSRPEPSMYLHLTDSTPPNTAEIDWLLQRRRGNRLTQPSSQKTYITCTTQYATGLVTIHTFQ